MYQYTNVNVVCITVRHWLVVYQYTNVHVVCITVQTLVDEER